MHLALHASPSKPVLHTTHALLVFFPFLLFAIPALAHPLSPRNLVKQGPEGDLDPLTRWRDTVGTALRVHGPVTKFEIRSALRDGPISSVYRSALLSPNASDICHPARGRDCAVALNGFGTVGEVRYRSTLFSKMLSARSTQTMVACRCLSMECGEAVLIRPINVISRETNTRTRRLCLYEQVDGKFSECHAEMLRVSYRQEDSLPFQHGSDYFWYHSNGRNEDWWAIGQRAWTRNCYEDDVASLRRVDISAIQSNNIAFNIHNTSPNNSCEPPLGVEYVVSESDSDGEECALLYDYAASGGAQRGTQQDTIAIGGTASTYISEQPELIGNTEVTLVSSAAGLGIMFVWGLYITQMRRLGGSWRGLAFVLMKQILGYSLEALPLHTALGTEITAGNWRSLFAFMDATLAVKDEAIDAQGDVTGSVLVLTGLVGEVQYVRTRESMMWVLATLFDGVVVVVILATLLRKGRRIWRADRGIGSQILLSSSKEGKRTKNRILEGRIQKRFQEGWGTLIVGRSKIRTGKGVLAGRVAWNGSQWSSGSPGLSLSQTSGSSLSESWSSSSSLIRSRRALESSSEMEAGGENKIREGGQAYGKVSESDIGRARIQSAEDGITNTTEADTKEENPNGANCARPDLEKPNISGS